MYTAVLLLSLPIFGQNSTHNDETISHITRASKTLRESYSDIKMSYILTDNLEDGRLLTENADFFCNLFNEKRTCRINLKTTVSSNTTKALERQSVFLQRPDGLYEIRKNENGWLIHESYPEVKDICLEIPFTSSPFQPFMSPVSRLGYNIEDCFVPGKYGRKWHSIILQDSNKLYKDGFIRLSTQEVSDKPIAKTQYTFSSSWHVIKCRLESAIDKNKFKEVEMDYQSFKGREYPKEIRITNSNGKSLLNCKVTFSEPTECKQDQSFYSFKQFDLPEPVETSSRGQSYSIVLLSCGLCFGLISALIWLIARKSK